MSSSLSLKEGSASSLQDEAVARNCGLGLGTTAVINRASVLGQGPTKKHLMRFRVGDVRSLYKEESMDMKKKAEEIYLMGIQQTEKIRLLNELILDCYNEMEAQDQNMHPEIRHNNAEGFRVAKNFLRILDAS